MKGPDSAMKTATGANKNGAKGSTSPGNGLLARYVQDFLVFLEVDLRRSPNTLRSYRRTLNDFLAFLSSIGVEKPEEVTKTTIRLFLREKGGSSASVEAYRACLSSFFNFLMSEGLLTQNPVKGVKTPKTHEKVPNVLPEEDIREILREARDDYLSLAARPTKKNWTRRFLALRNYLILAFLASTGVRVGELVKIRIQDILWLERKIRVRRKGGKEQLVPFPLEKLREDLLTYLDMREGLLAKKGVSVPYLFVSAKRGLPLREVDVDRIVKGFARSLGLPVRITPHTFRHSLATAMLSRGTPVHVVKEVLGHTSLNTTMKYVHLIKGEAQEAVTEFGENLLPGGQPKP